MNTTISSISQSNKFVNSVAVLLLVLMLCLAFFSMRTESATMDELAHTPAGYSYITQKDMRLNPEHPPLLKDLAGFSVWLGSKITGKTINFPSQHQSWQTDINGQWEFGRQLFYHQGNDADSIIFWGRLPMLLIMLLLGFYVFKWARELYGNKAGLLALFLYSLSPTFIAHSRYVTTDVGATAAFFIATYYLIKWLNNQNKKNLIIAGIVFGLALLTKFSLSILIPYFVFLVIVWALTNQNWKYIFQIRENPQRGFSLRRNARSFCSAKNHARSHFYASEKQFPIFLKTLLRTLLALLLIGLIGMAVIWPVYQFHTWNYPVERQANDTIFTLESFGNRALADPVIWMTDKPILRPYGQFFFGLLMVIQRSAGGNTTYFLGEVANSGWRYYFPTVFLIKVPLAFLILILISLFSVILSYRRRISRACEKKTQTSCEILQSLRSFRMTITKLSQLIKNHFTEFALISFLVLYWALSIQSTLNIGVRHVLPTFPVLYILISGQIIKLMNNEQRTTNKIIIKNKELFIVHCSLFIVLVWYAFSTISIYPYFLTHFNALAGGPENGYKYVADSNLDWGQDLKRLTKWVNENNIDTIYIDYFGGGEPSYYLGDKFQPWWGDRDPADLPSESWLAVSATLLQGGRAYHKPDYDKVTDYYRWLDKYEPATVIGNSIFVYYIN